MSISQDQISQALHNLDASNQRLLLEKLDQRARIEANRRFLPFIKYIHPSFTQSRHHEVIAEHLEAVEAGEIPNLMVFMPPRASKSFMISQYFPPWYIGKHPNHQVLAVTYSSDLTQKFGRFCRNTVQSPEFQSIFPGVDVSADSRASERWNTTKGGEYNAGSIKGGIAGKGAHLGIIDDPLNEQDAWSKAAREHVITWFPGGFTSRLMPRAPTILLMTRWHDDDLAGYCQRMGEETGDEWKVLSIPAILDEAGSKLLGYPQGTSFWPVPKNAPEESELAGWPIDELEKKKRSMPDYQWQALYMQRPVNQEGNILKRDWWKFWDQPKPPRCSYTFLSLDTAFSTKNSADFSVITAWGVFQPPVNDEEKPENCLICLGMTKGRWDFSELRARTMAAWKQYGETDVILVEKKASGQSLIQELQKAGLPVFPYNPDGDKESRAHACTPILNSSRVWLPKTTKTGWQHDLMNECSSFPRGKNDDVVDATTQAILWVRDGLFIHHPKDIRPFDEDAPRKKARQGYW
jgi:phage uncharacterized protein (putative large terminase), C-terminal domain